MKFIKTKANLPWHMLLEQTLALLVCPFASRVAVGLRFGERRASGLAYVSLSSLTRQRS